MQGFFYGILGCEQSGNNSKYTTLSDHVCAAYVHKFCGILLLECNLNLWIDPLGINSLKRQLRHFDLSTVCLPNTLSLGSGQSWMGRIRCHRIRLLNDLHAETRSNMSSAQVQGLIYGARQLLRTMPAGALAAKTTWTTSSISQVMLMPGKTLAPKFTIH